MVGLVRYPMHAPSDHRRAGNTMATPPANDRPVAAKAGPIEYAPYGKLRGGLGTNLSRFLFCFENLRATMT